MKEITVINEDGTLDDSEEAVANLMGKLWLDVCPADLKKYFCKHGKYIGYKGVFRDSCPHCKANKSSEDIP